jgi:hypothetical protein
MNRNQSDKHADDRKYLALIRKMGNIPVEEIMQRTGLQRTKAYDYRRQVFGRKQSKETNWATHDSERIEPDSKLFKFLKWSFNPLDPRDD